jgi:hypothetical protein
MPRPTGTTVDRRPLLGASRRAVAALTLATVGLGGCGSGAGSPVQSAESSGPVVQSTTLPAEWPAGLTLPDGASVTYSTTDGSTLSAMFDAPQDLPTLRIWFDGVLTELGSELETDASFAEVLATKWSDGTTTISVTATPVETGSSGLVVVEVADPTDPAG